MNKIDSSRGTILVRWNFLLWTCAHDCNTLPISFSAETPNFQGCWRLKPFPLATYLYLNDKLRDLYNEWRKADLIKIFFNLTKLSTREIISKQTKRTITYTCFQNKNNSMLTFQNAYWQPQFNVNHQAERSEKKSNKKKT